MARLYADEDFPGPVVEMLRDLGHDVLTVQEAGRRGAADPQVLADATADSRAVLTHNHRHYQRLHARQAHAGIVSCTRDKADLMGMALRIHDAMTAAPNLANQFIRITRPNSPAHTINVSSSIPRCLRSVISAACAWSISCDCNGMFVGRPPCWSHPR